MKIKLNEHSLINHKWIDEQIKEMTISNDAVSETRTGYILGRIMLLNEIKEKLISTEKLADIYWDNGYLEGAASVFNKAVKKDLKHKLLNKEIDIL